MLGGLNIILYHPQYSLKFGGIWDPAENGLKQIQYPTS